MHNLLLIPGFILALFSGCGYQTAGDAKGSGSVSTANQEIHPLSQEHRFCFLGEGFCLKARFLHPPDQSNQKLVLTLDPSSQVTLSDYDWDLNLWMPEHGHPSLRVRFAEISPSQVRIERVFFSMRDPGDLWDLNFSISQGGSLVDTQTLQIRF